MFFIPNCKRRWNYMQSTPMRHPSKSMNAKAKCILKSLTFLLSVCLILWCAQRLEYFPSGKISFSSNPLAIELASLSKVREISNKEEEFEESDEDEGIDDEDEGIDDEDEGIDDEDEGTDDEDDDEVDEMVKKGKEEEEKKEEAEKTENREKDEEEKNENNKEDEKKHEKEVQEKKESDTNKEKETRTEKSVRNKKNDNVEEGDKSKFIEQVSGQNAPSLEDMKYGYCQKRRFREGMPFTAIASVPGSGNTWVRYLVEQVTGVYTTSLYCDKHLKTGGFFGECYGRSREGRNKTLGFKIHAARSLNIYDQCVLLIRNPLKAAAAEFQRQHNRSHVAVTKMENVPDKKTTSYLRTWLGFHKAWLKFPRPMLVLLHDELKLDLRSQLVRMCDFFQVTCSKILLDCIVARNEGSFHRPFHDDSHIFTKEHIRLAKDYEKEVITTVKQLRPELDIGELSL